MQRSIVYSSLFVSVLAACAQAEVIPVSYTFTVSLQPAGALSLRPHPNVVVMTGIGNVDVEAVTTPSGPVTNPLYNGTPVSGTNPLFENRLGLSPLDEFETRDFSSIGSQFSFLGWADRSGIIHRDLATRNVLLSTARGTFSSLPGAQFTFGSDAQADVRPPNIPIRWTAPESLRLYLNGDVSTNAYFEATITLDWTVIPSPGAAALLGLSGVIAARRRRS